MSHRFLMTLVLLPACLVSARELDGAEFSHQLTPSKLAAFLQSTQVVRNLDETTLTAMVPLQSGIYYVDCPNCNGGRQDQQLKWDISRPDEVECEFCRQRYPSPQYPMNESLMVHGPSGQAAEFRFWTNAAGRKHFFAAKRDTEARQYLAEQTYELACIYVTNGDTAAGRRAARLLNRFAEVFPNWCYHYDYPNRDKEISDGPVAPTAYRPDYRTARWTWWAYSDIPVPLVMAYDALKETPLLDVLSQETGIDVKQRIENDLIRNACEQVAANPETGSNMSPRAWYGIVVSARVIHEPKHVHDVVRRLTALVRSKFFYDSFWCEGSPDYGWQTLRGLNGVLAQLQGYGDPAGYVDSVDHMHFMNLDLEQTFPELTQARNVLLQMRLPNGRPIPVHDTWSTSYYEQPAGTEPFLIPALGHACVGGGKGPTQTQFHLTWSGEYGHGHGDNLSLLLFDGGREVLSDLGYTHTAYRGWTIASASHNTVVIDGKHQEKGSLAQPTDGSLLAFDASDVRAQWVRADGRRGYPDSAGTFDRTCIAVALSSDRFYFVDCFDVAGGTQHDYFLHGDADRASTITSDLTTQPLSTLLPDGMQWTPPTGEDQINLVTQDYYAYGFLRPSTVAELPASQSTLVRFKATEDAQPNLRVHLLNDKPSRLIFGENPSIRQTKEDDSRLERFKRPFVMQRHTSQSGKSRFVSVIEPIRSGSDPLITSVERIDADDGALFVKVTSTDRIDLIALRCSSPMGVELAGVLCQFQGDIGVLSVANDQVVYATAAGAGSWRRGPFTLDSLASASCSLSGIENQTLKMDFNQEPLPAVGSVIRLVTTDGWVYPFHVVAAQAEGPSLRIEVEELVIPEWNSAASHLRLKSFPHRIHNGPVQVQWSPRAIYAP
ncbi:MAG: heparinase II/III family protein [Pirellulales bacterium]